jgi:hypothetical protein
MHHFDRGSQYASDQLLRLMADSGNTCNTPTPIKRKLKQKRRRKADILPRMFWTRCLGKVVCS